MGSRSPHFWPKLHGQLSSVDGLAAFLGKLPDHNVNRYFQSLEKFYEPRSPTTVPAVLEHKVKKDPRVLKLQEELSVAESCRAMAAL